jgi:hypothetical protein
MGLLDRLFGSEEALAKEIAHDDEAMVKIWNDYLASVSKKAAAKDLTELKALLETELVEIGEEEKDEEELIADLGALEHSERVRHIEKIRRCLGYPETKFKHAHALLAQIHHILSSQLHIVRLLLKGPKDAARLESHLKQQFELEQVVIGEVNQIPSFHKGFLALVKGKHVIKQMDAKEKKLEKMMRKAFLEETTEGIICEWTHTVFDSIKQKVDELALEGVLDEHANMGFEFVNRPEFVDFARETIASLRKRPVSESMLNVFVHLFREWYSHVME